MFFYTQVPIDLVHRRAQAEPQLYPDRPPGTRNPSRLENESAE